MRRKERIHPGRFDLSGWDRCEPSASSTRSTPRRHFGFRSADDYYHRASSLRIIDRIAVPTLVITAEDDPFVPSQPFHDPKIVGNPHIDLRVCEHGGHCGFVGPATGPGDDGYWAETQIVELVVRYVGSRRSISAPAAPAQQGAERASHDRTPQA